MPEEPSEGRSQRDRLTDVASVLYLFLVVATFAGFFLPRSGVRDTRLDLAGRACLLGLEWLSAAALVLLVVGLAAVASAASQRIPSEFGRRAARATATGAGFVLAVAYAVSWALFANLGAFLDRESLALASVDSLILFKHFIEVSPKLLVLLPLSALAFVWLLRRTIRSILEAASARTVRRLRIAAASVATMSVLAVLFGEIGPARASRVVPDARHGAYTTESEVYRHAQRHSSGPASHLLLSLARDDRIAAPGLAKQAAQKPIQISPIAIARRPLVELAAYTKRVDLPAEKRLNVIVLLVESLRPDVLRSTGGAIDVMPALDALARESRRFTRAYAESSHSDYADVCPMSSHYPLRSSAHHYYPKNPSYPRVLIYDVLKALGYRTAIVSSQNEQWGGMYNYLDTGSLDRFFHAETFHSTVVDPEDTVFSKWAKDYGHSGKVDDRYTIDEAIRWIGESEKPFFAYINLQNSHFPYRTPDDFPKRFAPYAIDFPYTFGSFPLEKMEVVKNRYRNSLAYMDAQFARLLDFLRKTGRLDRTILVVTGDNGEAFYEHGSAAHAGPVYEEAVRVPLVVHGPGVAEGDDDRIAQHIDVPPTILGALGAPQHPSFQGIDLLHSAADVNRSAYLLVQTAITSQLALVRGGYKLIADFAYGHYYLYDLAQDPGETKDLADKDPDRVARMAGRLHAFQKAQLDYYANLAQQKATYPPVLSEQDP